MHSLAWSPDGTTLYGVSSRVSGQSTRAGVHPMRMQGFVHGMAFQPGTGTLYAIVGRSYASSIPSILRRAISFVTSLSHGYLSLEFLPDGTLLAGGDGGLYTIDPVTGAETLIGYTGTGVLIGLEGVPRRDRLLLVHPGR